MKVTENLLDMTSFFYADEAEDILPVEELTRLIIMLLRAHARGSKVSVRATSNGWFVSEPSKDTSEPSRWKYVEPMEYLKEMKRLEIIVID